MNVGSLLTTNAIRLPDKIAVIEGDKRVSYREFNNKVNLIGSSLVALDIKKGEKVAVFLHNCLEWAEIYFAISKIGAVIVPINYRIIGNELLHVIGNSNSTVLIFGEELQKVVESVKPHLKKIKYYIFVGSNPPSWSIDYKEFSKIPSSKKPEVFISEEDAHTICYTSGTTGLPKGAVLTNLNVIMCHYYMTTSEFSINRNDVFLITTPLCQRIGWGKLVNSIALGCSLVMMGSFDPVKAMELMEKERITIASIIPSIGKMMLQIPHIESYDSSSLRMFFVTGEAFPIETKLGLIKKFPHVKLLSYFASTEAALISVMRPEDISRKPDSVGQPIVGLEVKILDDAGDEVPIGQVGEIVTRCGRPGVFSTMKGYYKNPEADTETFLNDWIKTGDIGRFDDERFLYILDRKRDMIISGGYNIYSREVEMVLESHPKVAEVAVVGVSDEKYGEAVKAYVVLRPGQKSNKEEMIQYCKEKLANYKKPKYIEFINSLPRNSVGKVLKYKLKGGS